MSSPSSPTRAGTSGSPGEVQESKPKRRRKALSCYDCRRRKLKCDRELPTCNRCRKAGQASSCSYDERALPPMQNGLNVPPSVKQSMPTPQAPPSWPPSYPGYEPRQLDRIENRLSSLMASQTPGTWQFIGEVAPATKHSQERPAIASDAERNLASTRKRLPTETSIFRGDNFQTQYYGSSNPTSAIAHFPQLRTFMKESIMHHTSLPRVQRDLKAIMVKWKSEKTNLPPVADLELLQLLPGREIVDSLLHLYFDTCENVYRILHRPSFWKEYQMFWEDQAANPAFVIILFLVMATANCLSPKEKPAYIGDSAVAREQAVLWIEVSEAWLGRQSQKNIYLAIWQIRCLLVLAKQVNISKKKRSWTVAGTLVREGMSAGLHRDPNLLGEKVSAFDQEMRRRLWATMTEMELQASVDRGMPSASAGTFFDCAAVSNVKDEDLTVECDTLPESRPWNEPTASSFLHISRASFSLRASLTALINDLSSPSRYDEVLNYEEVITKELRKLPVWSTSGNSQDTGMPLVARTLLDVQLRQYLILLHAPFARLAEDNPRHSLSRMTCFNAAAKIIDGYSQLAESGNSVLLLLRYDYFRGALTICHVMCTSQSIQNDLFLKSNTNTFVRYVEDTLVLLEDRITRLGTGYTHYWYISAALGLLRSAMQPSESRVQKQQAIDRVARQYYRILASQEDFSKAKEKILPPRLSKTSSTLDQMQLSRNVMNGAGMPFFDTSVPPAPFDQDDLPLDQFYFGDPAAWTFDNLWPLD